MSLRLNNIDKIKAKFWKNFLDYSSVQEKNDMQKFLLRRNEIVSNDKICDLDKKIKGYYDYY